MKKLKKSYKIKEMIQLNEIVFLPSWQRTVSWSRKLVLFLLETIIKNMKFDYCKVDAMKIGTYDTKSVEKSICHSINYIDPEVGKSHIKVERKKTLNNICHVQDGGHRLTIFLFMLFGKFWKENKKIYELFFNIPKLEFIFRINTTKTKNKPVHPMTKIKGELCIRSSELFKIFLETKPDKRADVCKELGFDYNDVEPICTHILEYEIGTDVYTYSSIREAIDHFQRTNSGLPLSPYQLFINKLVGYVGDYEFDKFFSDAKDKVNKGLPQNYFTASYRGKEEFALNLMTQLIPNERFVSLDHDFDPEILKTINEDKINKFANRLKGFLLRLLNTQIEVEGWKTSLPYDYLFKSGRIGMLPLVRAIDSPNTKKPLPEEAKRYLIYLCCVYMPGKHGYGQIHMSKDFHDEDFEIGNLANWELSAKLEDIPIKNKIRLVASSYLNTGVKEHLLIKKNHLLVHKHFLDWNFAYRSNKPLSDKPDLYEIEASRDNLAPLQNSPKLQEKFFDSRKERINERLEKLLVSYDIWAG